MPSKPHLRLIHGIWHCGYRKALFGQRYGLGYDIFGAWVDWEIGR